MESAHLEGTLFLDRRDVAGFLTAAECVGVVEEVFRAYGEGKLPRPGILGVHAGEGGFHIKAGLFSGKRDYFAAKINGNFPGNPERNGLPTIQGVIYLADAANGYPLALMDSIEITIRRTGAATAVAAKHLARKNSATATVIGCGNQGRSSIESLLAAVPLKRAFVCDADERKAHALAGEFSGRLAVEAIGMEQLASSLRESDICVTCTPSKRPIVHAADLPKGIFIAAVGADNEEKQEIDPAVFSSAKIVTDLTDQCAVIGDLHHALALGIVKQSDVHGELGEIAAGVKRGRTTDEEVTLFDSTGMALQDVAAAARVYEKALAAGAGRVLRLNSG